MKQLKRFFLVLLLLFYFQAGSFFAQGGLLIGKGLVYGAGLFGNKDGETKQEKIVARSSKQERISGLNVTLVRVKESDIKSKAKQYIVALQNRLDQYAAQYKNNQPLDIPKNDSDIAAIQEKDENWPIGEYLGELRAYKRYAFQQKQKTPAAPVNRTPGDNVKSDTTAAKP